MVTPVGQAAWNRLAARARPLDEAALRRLSPILIISPHQDDETLGCGGLIATASALGLRPRIAYLTDGAASHIGSPSWPPARLAAVRRDEALEALAVLGVPSGDVRFLGWPDASPYAAGSRDHDQTLTGMLAWMSTFRPRGLWAPWEEESHCDHLAAACVARDLADRSDGALILMSYLVWAWTLPDLAAMADDRQIWGIRCPATVVARQQALACHRTQTTPLIDDAQQAFLVAPELAAITRRPVEIHLGQP